MSRKLIIPSIIIACISLGCGKDSTPETPPPPPPPNGEYRDLPTSSPNITYATGWTEMILTANSARTTIGIGAHFSTTRNACGVDAYGSLPIEDWNKLSAQANIIASDPQGLTHDLDYCVPIPDNVDYLTRTGLSVEMKINQSTQLIYELRGDQICTNIKDHTVSNSLLAALEKVVQDADKEDCPNGWGS